MERQLWACPLTKPQRGNPPPLQVLWVQNKGGKWGHGLGVVRP